MVELIKQMFEKLIESPDFEEKDISKYFSGNYIQLVDNRELRYPDFVRHVMKLKEKISSAKVEFINIAQNEHSVFTKHIVRSTLKDGTQTTHKVFAEFIVIDEKIIACDELTLMLEGPEKEKNLGSET